MSQLNENLVAKDLRNLVKPVFEVDNYQSKVGDDENVVVLSFVVDHEDPAKDLEHFFEMGYNFILDADVSPGELDDGKYRVYVEMERNRHIAEQISEIIEGVKKLTGIDDFRFRYFKNFKSHPATLEVLEEIIPKNKEEYDIASERNKLDNFQEFFINSFADEVALLDESISFKRTFVNPISFNIITSGPKEEVYSSIKGPIMMESKDIAETMFLTKYIGDYNITKIGSAFIFDKNNWAVALERNQ
jgi:hypothetical protein